MDCFKNRLSLFLIANTDLIKPAGEIPWILHFDSSPQRSIDKIIKNIKSLQKNAIMFLDPYKKNPISPLLLKINTLRAGYPYWVTFHAGCYMSSSNQLSRYSLIMYKCLLWEGSFSLMRFSTISSGELAIGKTSSFESTLVLLVDAIGKI